MEQSLSRIKPYQVVAYPQMASILVLQHQLQNHKPKETKQEIVNQTTEKE
jgi:hypothetical protein